MKPVTVADMVQQFKADGGLLLSLDFGDGRRSPDNVVPALMASDSKLVYFSTGSDHIHVVDIRGLGGDDEEWVIKQVGPPTLIFTPAWLAEHHKFIEDWKATPAYKNIEESVQRVFDEV